MDFKYYMFPKPVEKDKNKKGFNKNDYNVRSTWGDYHEHFRG